MELRDYGVALRRHWRAGVGVALACLLAAVVVVLATPATYRATAQVFVASTGEGTSGSQFVNQRVTSYPDVARSRAVLDPVIRSLGLDESFADLRERVEATNPLETSQIDIAVTGRDAAEAARVADAVAEEFGTVVEQLERRAARRQPRHARRDRHGHGGRSEDGAGDQVGEQLRRHQAAPVRRR